MKIEQLTFTRFLAAVSIVIFHYGSKSIPFNNDLIGFIFKHADVGVSYFFILSGFVMMIAYGNKRRILPSEYFKNRFARIYPLYFIAILLTLLQQMLTKNIDFLGMILSVFMIQAWIPGKLLIFNPPAWTLSVEFLFYAIFPFVYNKLFAKIDFKKMSVYIVIFWIISQVIGQILFMLYDGKFLGYPLLHINEFLIGNLAGYYFINHLKERKGNYDLMILILVFLLILALKFLDALNFHTGLLALIFVQLILLISINDGWITKIFSKKPFVFLGEISFGIYILQYPVYSLISAYSVKKYLNIADPTASFYLRLVFLIVFSAVLYVYLEKPVQKIIKSNKIAFFDKFSLTKSQN